jgi:peroxiredoxin
MAQLEPLKFKIEEAGAQLVYIAAEKRGGMFKPEQFLEKNPVSYPFLLDEDRTATKAYGLYHRLGTDAINIAHPATLVVDPQAMVRYIYRGDSQTDRSPVEEMLAALSKSQSST